MTESEAKDKWCPFVRVPSGQHVSWNRVYKDGTNCLGSDCMAWRWTNQVEAVPNEVSAQRLVQHGCCGPAGRPND